MQSSVASVNRTPNNLLRRHALWRKVSPTCSSDAGPSPTHFLSGAAIGNECIIVCSVVYTPGVPLLPFSQYVISSMHPVAFRSLISYSLKTLIHSVFIYTLHDTCSLHRRHALHNIFLSIPFSASWLFGGRREVR